MLWLNSIVWTNMVEYSYLPMWLFLLVGAAANVPFLVRAVYEVVSHRARRRFHRLPEAGPALVAVSLSECCWVLPCLVQCFLTFALGRDGSWSPASEASSIGCNVMGFYSVFASFSGMISTLLIVIITYRSATGRAPLGVRCGSIISAVVFFGCLLFSALPFMGVGSFEYTGEGFCYFDWRSKPLSILMLLVAMASMTAVIALLSLTLRSKGWISRNDLIIMGIGFVSAWMLWIPATVIGLSEGTFPTKYMLTGAILGHLQALINPYIYGIRWRRSVLHLGKNDEASGVQDDLFVVDKKGHSIDL